MGVDISLWVFFGFGVVVALETTLGADAAVATAIELGLLVVVPHPVAFTTTQAAKTAWVAALASNLIPLISASRTGCTAAPGPIEPSLVLYLRDNLFEDHSLLVSRDDQDGGARRGGMDERGHAPHSTLVRHGIQAHA